MPFDNKSRTSCTQAFVSLTETEVYFYFTKKGIPYVCYSRKLLHPLPPIVPPAHSLHMTLASLSL